MKLANFKLKIHKHHFILIAILIFSLATRLWRLSIPSQEYFDEVYHLPAVRLIAHNDVRAYEWWHKPISEVGNDINNHDWLHPPLAKLIQASFINFFPDMPFFWRLPSALAGVGLVLVVYFLTKQVFSQLYNSKQKLIKLGLLSAFLTAVSGLLLVQSRILMNDIFLCLWLSSALLFYLRWQKKASVFALDKNETKNKNLILTGVCLGLAIATKWSGIFLLGFLLILSIVLIFKNLRNKSLKFLPLVIFSLLLLPALIYITSYGQMFLQGKNLRDFKELHQQIIWYQTHRNEGHDYASTPIQWLLNTKPVWYWTNSSENSLNFCLEQIADIYILENPVWHLSGLLSIVYFLIIIGKEFEINHLRLKTTRSRLYLFLLMAYGVVFMPWLASPRVMFYFHYLPAVPFLATILAEFLQSVIKKHSQVIYWLIILLIIIGFIVFYPIWTGLPVTNIWVQTIYFAIQSGK